MKRIALAAILCAGLLAPASTAAADRPGPDAVTRSYDPEALASGAVQVSVAGDVVWVSGVSDAGPWLDIWHRTGGEWTMVAEVGLTELKPIRFGARRSRSCQLS